MSDEVKLLRKKVTKLFNEGTIGPMQEAWLRTLLSGEFKQTRGTLCTKIGDGEYGHCCLGVGCEVAIANKVKGIKINPELKYEDEYAPDSYYVYRGHEMEDLPTYEFATRVLGLRDEQGRTDLDSKGENFVSDSLVEINDASDSFVPVVKAIVNHPTEYFAKVV